MRSYPMDCMIRQTYVVSGNEAATFIQVHPTFLYESMWNLVFTTVDHFLFLRRERNLMEN